MTKMFSFPFEPYDIQVDFMNTLYETIEKGKIGVFESPTGTGKSLSIICGALTWYLDNEKRERKSICDKIQVIDNALKKISLEEKTAEDWISLQNDKKQFLEEKSLVMLKKQAFELKDKRNEELKNVKKSENEKFSLGKNAIKRPKKEKLTENEIETEDDEYLVNYKSDDSDVEIDFNDQEQSCIIKPKIFYASRTHSQLSQFISEIKKTSFVKSYLLRIVHLGSRVNLCTNPKVTKSGNLNIINDKCLELKRNNSKCPFYKQSLLKALRDNILSEVHDIEEVASLGTASQTCSYFSSRLSVAEAQIVVLPYNILIHKASRESFGIDITNSVVIVDEAHNILEAVSNIHNIELKGSQILDAHTLLNHYLLKYNKRLNPTNLMYIKQLIFISHSLLKHLKTDASYNIFKIYDFLTEVKIDNLNILKILEYCEKSKIAQKLFGFSKYLNQVNINKNIEINEVPVSQTSGVKGTTAFLSKVAESKRPKKKTLQKKPELNNQNEEASVKYRSNQPAQASVPNGSPLYPLQEFLRVLINPSSDGRVLTTRCPISLKNSTLKFLLLNPGMQLKVITIIMLI